ncbi:MAG TPA: sensor histidine kinase [Candidatus Scybalocola faecipullorum]|nr:sensor histidine kinase [Candidatus Scybalocola faecipullorum]
MSFGHVIQMITNLTILFGGAILAVRPCPLRWNNIPVKVMLALCMAFLSFLTVGNTFYFKISITEYMITAFLLLIILFIFFKIKFFKLLSQLLIYRLPIQFITEYIILLISLSIQKSVAFYISPLELEWHWLHIVLFFIIITITFILLYKFRNGLLHFKRSKVYLYISLVLLFILVADDIIFQQHHFYDTTTNVLANYYVYFFSLCACIIIIFIILINHFEIKTNEKNLLINFELLKQQYTNTLQDYKTNSRKLHDMKYHYLLIEKYLKNNEINDALNYIHSMIKEIDCLQKNHYSGINEIDCLLSNKITYAKKFNIQIILNLNVLFNPIKDYEICILLGNLLDNAIEAVQSLENTQKKIYLNMRTENSMFILKITNPYKGARNISDSHYLTTKSDKTIHGFGLDSVKNILNSYGGKLEIVDDGNTFCVMAIIFKKY